MGFSQHAEHGQRSLGWILYTSSVCKTIKTTPAAPAQRTHRNVKDSESLATNQAQMFLVGQLEATFWWFVEESSWHVTFSTGDAPAPNENDILSSQFYFQWRLHISFYEFPSASCDSANSFFVPADEFSQMKMSADSVYWCSSLKPSRTCGIPVQRETENWTLVCKQTAAVNGRLYHSPTSLMWEWRKNSRTGPRSKTNPQLTEQHDWDGFCGLLSAKKCALRNSLNIRPTDNSRRQGAAYSQNGSELLFRLKFLSTTTSKRL